MKLKDILDEVRYGEDYDEMKLIEDLLDDCEEIEELEEGVKYFKVSKRLNKLAERLQKKVKEVPQAKGMVSKAKSAARKFEAVEKSFATGAISKAQARVKYDAIKKDYKDVMSALKKKELMTALKVAGAVAIVAGIVAAILFGLQPLAAAIGVRAAPAVVPPGIKEFLGRDQKVLEKTFGRPSLAPKGPGKFDPTKIFGRSQLTPENLKKLGVK